MANFSTAFGLCSITESKGLLGVCSDDEGCAVVTLGKSMVIRCRLSDQKQLNSWSTALSKLSSKVVWNAINENYVGVFDNVYIKQWTKSDSSLEKTKKIKFKNEIHEILLYSVQNILKKPQLIVLFKNGFVKDLESALEKSKEPVPDVIHSEETIEMANIIIENNIKYLILITKFKNKYRQCYCIQLQEENFIVTDIVKKIKLRRPGSSLLGCTIFAAEKGNSLLTFWSDGFLYSLPLPIESEKPGVGKYLGTIGMVSRNSEMVMQPVSKDHIAIFGADPSEEGASLGIYNVKFGVIQAQTSFKMFNKPPRMWLIDDNLVTVMEQRLVCVPFNLQTETLSALVGSRALHAHLKTPSEICTIVPTAVWDENVTISENKPDVEYPDKIKEQLLAFSSEGWSEFGICQALVSHLIEAKDINTLFWCLNNFTDIPEDHLVRMIQLALKDSEEAFKKTMEEDLPEVDVKTRFLNKILSIPVDNFSLLKNLRQLFSFEDCLLLMNHLYGMFSQEGNQGDVPVEDSASVLEWTMTLLDAFYQQFVLSKDSEVLKLMLLLKDKVDENVMIVNNLEKLLSVINRLKSRKDIVKNPGHSKTYSVERFRLYE